MTEILILLAMLIVFVLGFMAYVLASPRTKVRRTVTVTFVVDMSKFLAGIEEATAAIAKMGATADQAAGGFQQLADAYEKASAPTPNAAREAFIREASRYRSGNPLRIRADDRLTQVDFVVEYGDHPSSPTIVRCHPMHLPRLREAINAGRLNAVTEVVGE